MRMIGVIGGISGEVICKRLHERGLGCLIIAGKQGESGTDIADRLIVEDLSHVEKIYSMLVEEGVKEIIIGTGHILAFELAAYLEKHGIITSIDYETSLLAKDKIKYKETLVKKGLRTPKFLTFTTNDESSINQALDYVGIPCVVKSSIDRILPQKCNSLEELRSAFADIAATDSEILVEEFVQGVDCTIPYLHDMQTVTPLMLSYYSKAEACELKGFGTFKNHSMSKEMEQKTIEYCKTVVEKIPTLGLGRIDAIVTDNEEIYILECNSVMVTGVHPNQIQYGLFFIEKEGVDFAGMLVDVALKIFEAKRQCKF